MTNELEPSESPSAPKKPDKSMIFMGMGIEAIVAVLAGFWLGQQVDGYLGNRGLGPAFGSILSLVAWFFHLLHVLKIYDREN